jgi:hypothetical protein
MLLETLGGGLLGGIFRLAPEVIKVFDAKNSRKHELNMLDKELQFAAMNAEAEVHRTNAAMTVAELDAMGAALKEQGQTARAAGKFVAAISALVRPIVTYWFVIMYSAVKIVTMRMAVASGGAWDEVLVTSWNTQDMATLTMILTFWFVGRVYERNK